MNRQHVRVYEHIISGSSIGCIWSGGYGVQRVRVKKYS